MHGSFETEKSALSRTRTERHKPDLSKNKSSHEAERKLKEEVRNVYSF